MQRHPWESGHHEGGLREPNYGAAPSFPRYAYKGSGLLDDDPKGLRKKKSLLRKVALKAVKLGVVFLIIFVLCSWLVTFTNKKILHHHISTTLAHQTDKNQLRRLLGERDERLKKKEQDLSEMRLRLEQLTGELGNTHNKHMEHSGKLQQNLLNCQGELLVAHNRVVELEHMAKGQEQLVVSLQQRLEAETHKPVQGDSVQVQENGYLRSELQECQNKLQKSSADNLDPGFLAEQQRLREQEAAAKAKLHASATLENLANWREHLPPGPTAVPVPAQQQGEQAQQQPQQGQQLPLQQAQQVQQAQQQAPQVQQAPQQVQQAPQQAQQAPQVQQGQPQLQQQQQAPTQEIPDSTGERPDMSTAQRAREAYIHRRQQGAERAKAHHALSQLEQALGHDAHEGKQDEDGEGH